MHVPGLIMQHWFANICNIQVSFSFTFKCRCFNWSKTDLCSVWIISCRFTLLISRSGEKDTDKQRLDSVFLKQNNQLNEDRDANRPGLHVAKGSHAINTVQEIIKHWTETKLLAIWFLHCGFVEETLHQVKNTDEWWIKIRANLIKWSSRDFCLSSELVLATGFV